MHLRTDPALVDVNVHPAKTEVRFQYPEEVQNLIALGIREKLRSGAWVGLEPETSTTAANQAAANSIGNATPPWSMPMPEPSAARHEASAYASPMRPQTSSFRSQPSTPRMTLSTRANGYGAESMAGGEGYSSKQKNDWSSTPVMDKASIDALLAHSSSESSVPVSGGSRFALGADEISAAAMPAVAWGDMQYMGTFARCYLMFTDQSRFLVVDQHAFHERIIYERLQRDRSLLQQSQRLLVPEALELAPASVAVLQERQADLKLRGFDFAIEGATTVLVNAVPSLLAGRDLNGLFEDLGEGLSDAGAGLGEGAGTKEPTDSNGEMLRLLLANVACHAAVRAGEELPLNEVKQLVAEAATVDFYHNCPHGRRVLRWWSKAQVEQWFDR
jgi:DNA mismatch repair protein MutL